MFKLRTFVLAALMGGVATVASAEQPIQMRVSSFIPEVHMLTALTKNYISELEAASNGEVMLRYHGSEALGKAVEQFDLTVEGLADMGVFCATYTPSRFPLTGMLELPFFSNSSNMSAELYRKLLENPAVASEFADVKLLLPLVPGPSQVYSNKKIETVADFQGLRFIGVGPLIGQTLELLGVQPVSMGYPDAYLALERGTIDGGAVSWAASLGWKWQEVADYPIDVNLFGGFACGIIMNKDSWGKLSPETQMKWEEISLKHGKIIADTYDANDEKAKAKWQDLGKPVYTFSEEEKQKMAEQLAPVWLNWIQVNKAAGRPAEELYRAYVAAMSEFGEPTTMKLPGLYQDR